MNRYSTLPPLPDRIRRLEELAVDLWWSWHPEGRAVFRRLDYDAWRATAHNPVRMLWVIPRARLEAATNDPTFLALYDRAIAALDEARAAHNTWWERNLPHLSGQSIAYFSAEFALHQSLPIYAGGLGVLAGDHCKEASDLGVPLIGVGFMYPQGYFHQHVSAEGWQEETNELLNWVDAPIEQAMTPDGLAVPDARAARRSIGDRGGLARAHRPRAAVPPRHQPRGKCSVGPRVVGAAVRRRSRDAYPAGDHPRNRRRARAPGARHRTGGLSSQRGPCRVRRPAADPRNDRPRVDVRRRARGDPADHRLHDAHPCGGRPRRVSVSPRGKASGRLLGHARAQSRTFPRARGRTTAAPASSST